jgi:hypothetical protein
MFRALLLTLLATPALADDPGFVTLPDDSHIAGAATPGFLMELVVANVVGMNCVSYQIGDGEWALLTGTADKVAEAIKVKDATEYDEKYYGPAFDLLDKPETCVTEGPKIAPLIARLKAMGGDTLLLRPLGG